MYTDKKEFFADQIYFPYYCNFKKNFLKKNNLTSKKKKSVHFILEFKNIRKFSKYFSYVQCSRFSRFIDRASTLSKNILIKNSLLFCVRISAEGMRLYKKNSSQLTKLIIRDILNYLNLNKDIKKFNFKYKYFGMKLHIVIRKI